MTSWTPAEWGTFIGWVLSTVFSALAAWHAKRAKQTVNDTAAKSEMRGAVSLTHLQDLKIGTEAIRSQTNGNTSELMAQNRELLSQINHLLVENGKLLAEVAGLRTARTGGRATDVPPPRLAAPEVKA